MSLSEEQILVLLETMDPQEILQTRSEDLDDAGRRLLDEFQEDMAAGAQMFEEYGRHFREADVASAPGSGEDAPIPVIWLRRSVRLPHWALAAAAVLAGIAVLPSLLDWQQISHHRGGLRDVAELQHHNQEVFEAHLKRAEALMELGNQQQEQRFNKEALADLMLAYEIEPENTSVLSMLARVHERLGHEKKAKTFYEEWKKANEAERDQEP